MAVTLLPTKVPVDPVLAAAARCVALASVVGAGWIEALLAAVPERNGDAADVLLPNVGLPTRSACEGGISTRCAGAAGSSESSDGHNSEQPAIKKPHANGKTNLLIPLILGCHPANSLLYLTPILL